MRAVAFVLLGLLVAAHAQEDSMDTKESMDKDTKESMDKDTKDSTDMKDSMGKDTKDSTDMKDSMDKNMKELKDKVRDFFKKKHGKNGGKMGDEMGNEISEDDKKRFEKMLEDEKNEIHAKYTTDKDQKEQERDDAACQIKGAIKEADKMTDDEKKAEIKKFADQLDNVDKNEIQSLDKEKLEEFVKKEGEKCLGSLFRKKLKDTSKGGARRTNKFIDDDLFDQAKDLIEVAEEDREKTGEALIRAKKESMMLQWDKESMEDIEKRCKELQGDCSDTDTDTDMAAKVACIKPCAKELGKSVGLALNDKRLEDYLHAKDGRRQRKVRNFCFLNVAGPRAGTSVMVDLSDGKKQEIVEKVKERCSLLSGEAQSKKIAHSVECAESAGCPATAVKTMLLKLERKDKADGAKADDAKADDAKADDAKADDEERTIEACTEDEPLVKCFIDALQDATTVVPDAATDPNVRRLEVTGEEAAQGTGEEAAITPAPMLEVVEELVETVVGGDMGDCTSCAKGDACCFACPKTEEKETGTSWDKELGLCVATFEGATKACQEARGRWSWTCTPPAADACPAKDGAKDGAANGEEEKKENIPERRLTELEVLG